jgi:hypothetical protein
VVLALGLLMATVACPAALPPGAVSVRIAGPAHVRAGDLLTLRATLASRLGTPSYFGVSWGDGTPESHPVYSGGLCPLRGTPVLSPSPPPPGSAVLLFVHRYRTLGAHTVKITAGHMSFCGVNPISGTGRGSFVVQVTGPPAAGNGAGDPMPSVGLYKYKNGILHGDLAAQDGDGYLASITVTWPGGQKQVFRNPIPCKDPGVTWPESDVQFFWTRAMKPGMYSITAKAVSTDCRGGSEQVITDIRPFLLTSTGWNNDGPNVYLPHEPRDAGTLNQGTPACCPVQRMSS